MATNKRKQGDIITDIKGKFPAATPWVFLGINIVAAGFVLLEHYRKETSQAFISPYTHIHYMDEKGEFICGDKYINKKHICDGRFLIAQGKVPTLEDFVKIGLTKEQYEETQNILNQFKCEG